MLGRLTCFEHGDHRRSLRLGISATTRQTPHSAHVQLYTSSIALSPVSTPLNHLPFSSSSSPIPPAPLRILASCASPTALSFLSLKGSSSSCRRSTSRRLAGSAAARRSSSASTSARRCCRSERSSRVGWRGSEREGLVDLGSWADWRVVIWVWRSAISRGRDSS